MVRSCYEYLQPPSYSPLLHVQYIRSLPHASDGRLVHTQPEQALSCGDNGFAAHGSLTSFGKVKFTLEHVMQAQAGSKGLAPLL